MPPDSTSHRSDLERILQTLSRRWMVIIGCALVATAVAVGVSLAQQKEYAATASLLFQNSSFAEELFGDSSSNFSPDPSREAATNEKLVGLKIVGHRAAKQIPGLNGKEVSEMVSVSAEGEADVVSVTATSADPQQAKVVANTFARQFISFRASADKSKLLEAKDLAELEYSRLSKDEQSGARGQALSRGAERLGLLASLQTGNAELVQPAELPTSPATPKPLRNGVLGLLLGLLLGVGGALVLESLSRKLRDPEEVRDVFGLPVVGTIPESKAILEANDGSASAELPFFENESFRTLRSALRYFSVDREMTSLLVVSYGASVGKSTVSWNLARVSASAGRTILVETDLRNGQLSTQHRLTPGPGLSQVLTHQADLESAIRSVSFRSSDELTGEADVLPAGFTPPNPAELLESDAMKELLATLRNQYDTVIIDTAPLGVVPDAFPLLRQVDGVIAVARLRVTTTDEGAHLRDQTARAEAPLLGVVVNGVKVKRGNKYGYGYYAAADDRAKRPAPTTGS